MLRWPKFTQELTSEDSASPRPPKSSSTGPQAQGCEAAQPAAALAARYSASQEAGLPVTQVGDAAASAEQGQDKAARSSPGSSQVRFVHLSVQMSTLTL